MLLLSWFVAAQRFQSPPASLLCTSLLPSFLGHRPCRLVLSHMLLLEAFINSLYHTNKGFFLQI